MSNTKQGKNSKKHGRSARKPSHTKYNAEQRWEKNKIRKIEKQKRIEEKQRRKKEQASKAKI